MVKGMCNFYGKEKLELGSWILNNKTTFFFGKTQFSLRYIEIIFPMGLQQICASKTQKV